MIGHTIQEFRTRKTQGSLSRATIRVKSLIVLAGVLLLLSATTVMAQGPAFLPSPLRP